MNDASLLLFEYSDKKILLAFLLNKIQEKNNLKQPQTEQTLNLCELLSGILESDLLLFDFEGNNPEKTNKKEPVFPELLHVSQEKPLEETMLPLEQIIAEEQRQEKRNH